VSSAGTFGQAIPALLPASSSGSPAPLIIGGLENNANFRTNLGFVNLGAAPIDVTATVFGGSIAPMKFTALAAGALTQVALPATGSAPVGVSITSSDPKALYAYASMIDQKTNDPAFIEAVPLDRLTAAETVTVPGIGRIGAWRSDLLLLNPHAAPLTLSLSYRGDNGLTRSSATVVLGSGVSTTLTDVIGNALFTPKISGDTIGAVTISAKTATPFVFARTYNQTARGTFGQGIAPLGAAAQKLERTRVAVLAGVQEDDKTYTNLGLMSFAPSGDRSLVKITLLDAADRSVAGTLSLPLDADESRIVPHILTLFGTKTSGTLQLELESGGPVWVYASLVDQLTKDPEYVPASILP